MRVTCQDPPWKVVRAFAQPGGGSLVHLNNVSGGVLAGDRLRLDVEVEPGEITQITTTGATRLYRHRPGAADSEHYAVISVGEGALMEYLPDAVIPYAGSRHTQRTEIKLASGAALFWWEILAPGRQAAGERFAFERLCVQSEVRAGTRPVVRERFLLEPAVRPLGVTARMQEYGHIASFYACQEGRPPAFWRMLESQLNELAKERTQSREVVWGASTLASDGVIVRGLSVSSRWIHPALIEFWCQARLAVTGQEAIPPRKIS
jgi:urease accessory protein